MVRRVNGRERACYRRQRNSGLEFAKARPLSTVMRNLNRLVQDPAESELGRRAVRHLGFPDD